MRLPAIALGLMFCLLPIAHAEDTLPRELTGSAMWSGAYGNRQTVVPFSMTIESQAPTGEIKGKMSWNGRGGCVVSDRPFSGMFRDGALEFSAPAVPNCGAISFKLMRVNAGEFAFDGTAVLPNSISAAVNIKPR